MHRIPVLVGLLVVLGFLAPPPATADAEPGRAGFPATIPLPDGFAPEGITTGRGTTAYVGSLQGEGLWRGDVRTGRGEVLEASTGTGTIVGIDYDPRRNLIWAAGGPDGEVRAYDARIGEVVATFEVEAGFLNDLVVTRDAVYVTDSFSPQLVVLPLPNGRGLPDAAETLPLTGDLDVVPGQFNLNGIVESGRYLVAVQSTTGLLFRIDPGTDEARTEQVDVDVELTAGDGLELRGRTLYVVRNQLNQVAVVQLSGTLTEGTLVDTLTAPSFDIPTTATLAAGRLWAVNARFGTAPTPDTEYWISQVPLR